MYIVNKIVGVMMSPSVLLMLMCVVCAAVGFGKSRRFGRIGRIGLWAGLALLWFWMSAIPGRILGLPLEREWLVNGEIPTAESFPMADAIVCLGGGMDVATNVVHGANICPASDRVWMAARLWKHGKAPKIICTGPTSRESTRGLLLDFGVPAEAMTFLEKARNTEEEAKGIVGSFDLTDCLIGGGFANQTIKQPNNHKILLVTSSWHMRRAKLMFEKYAPQIEVIPAPTDFEATVGFDNGFDLRELLPGRAYMNEVYLREWIGYLGYKWLRK